jgi:hypothetical protein
LADQFEAGLIQMGDAVGTCGICGQGIIAKEVKGEGDNFGRPVQVFAFARHAPARYVVCAEKGHTNFYWLDKSSGKAVEPLGNKVNLNSGIPYSLRTVNGMIEQWKEIEIFFPDTSGITVKLFVPKYVTVMPSDARSVTLNSSGAFGEGSQFDVDLLGFTAGVSKFSM